MKSYLLGLAVVIVSAALLYFAWSKYEDFLYQGRRPPEGLSKLISIEKTGIPDVEMTDIQGNKHALKSFSGSVVIINFWASWCEPCVKEFPSLIKLIEKFKGKIKIVAVSGDYERQDIDIFLKAFNVKNPNFIVVWDKEQNIAKSFGTFKLPESFVFGPKGEFIRKIVGVDDWATKDAFMFFEDILKSKEAP